MNDLTQQNQGEYPEEGSEKNFSSAIKQSIASCCILGALIIFSPNTLLTAFAVVIFLLAALFVSLFLKRWFLSWEKALHFSQGLLFYLFVGVFVALTFLYS
jgi:hypothetical protein